jgi:predicted phosphodiesterase
MLVVFAAPFVAEVRSCSMFANEPLCRRKFLEDGSLLLLGAGLTACQATWLLAEDSRPLVRIGLVTDLHYADKPAAGTRHYRETLAKLEQAGELFRRAKPDLVIELGDFIDAADSVEVEKKFLATINKEFAALPGEKHYVLGNHCVATLTKEEFLGEVGQKAPHYSFDAGGVHCIVLDACFRADGEPYGRDNFKWNDANVPEDQIEWLAGDLRGAEGKTIVFLHQRLDVENDYGVKNASEIRELLERSGKVLAVFQGHSHKNDATEIRGIHYCTLAAMVEGTGLENNGYAVMEVLPGGTIRIDGYGKQAKYEWPA